MAAAPAAQDGGAGDVLVHLLSDGEAARGRRRSRSSPVANLHTVRLTLGAPLFPLRGREYRQAVELAAYHSPALNGDQVSRANRLEASDEGPVYGPNTTLKACANRAGKLCAGSSANP